MCWKACRSNPSRVIGKSDGSSSAGSKSSSEASRHLPDELKARHSRIPWPKVAGIGNVLRHDYQRIAPDVLWKLVLDDLPDLEQSCRH